MKEFSELKNGRDILNDAFEKFESLTHRAIKKDICDALWAMNHFIHLNEEESDSQEMNLTEL